jgi:hypothetical protein
LFGKLLNSTRKECEKGEAAIADARRLHPDRQVADFHIFSLSNRGNTSHNMSPPFYTFLYLSCFRCPLCQGRVCRSGVPEEHDWWVIPAQMRLRP